MILTNSAKSLNKPTLKDGKLSSKTSYLYEKINKYNKEELGKILKIKNKTLDKTYTYYNLYKTNYYERAINLYSGKVFQQIKEDLNEKNNYNYLNNVFILSAMYGIVNANDSIKEYRLDFTNNDLVDLNLYKYWKEEVNNYLIKLTKNQNSLSLLALVSNEFLKLLDFKLLKDHNIIIYQLNCIDKLSSYKLKEIRGNILDYCIKNKITDYQKLISYTDDLVYVKEIKDNQLYLALK